MSIYPRSRVKDVLLGGAIFVALGPPVGLVVFWINFTIREQLDFDPVVGPMRLGPSLIYLLGAYFFGGLPCLLTGLVVGGFRSRIRSLASCLAVGLLCLGLASAPLAIFGKDGSLASNLVFFGLPGLVAGTVCAWVFRARPGKGLNPA